MVVIEYLVSGARYMGELPICEHTLRLTENNLVLMRDI